METQFLPTQSAGIAECQSFHSTDSGSEQSLISQPREIQVAGSFK